MIRPPRRAVTRFFIPLIDVLILLFCIFLLMPFVEKGAASGAKLTPGQVEQLRRQLELLDAKVTEMQSLKEPEHLLAQIEELKRELAKSTADKLRVKTFQIDAKTGALSYHQEVPGGTRKVVELEDAAAAEALISRDKAEILGTNKEWLYIILYPRDPASKRPTREQENEYKQWFQGVTTRWETGDTAVAGGAKP